MIWFSSKPLLKGEISVYSKNINNSNNNINIFSSNQESLSLNYNYIWLIWVELI